MDTDMDTTCKAFLISRMSDLEYRMSINGDEKV